MRDVDSIIVNLEILPVPKEIKKWKAPDYTMAWITMSVGGSHMGVSVVRNLFRNTLVSCLSTRVLR
jgi:cytosine/uracil/thiamine/allantoin permease